MSWEPNFGRTVVNDHPFYARIDPKDKGRIGEALRAGFWELGLLERIP